MKSLFRISVALSTMLGLAIPALGHHPNHQQGDQLQHKAPGPIQHGVSQPSLPGATGPNQHEGSHQLLQGAPESQQHRDSHQIHLEGSESNQHGFSHQFLSEASESQQPGGSHQIPLGAPASNQYGRSHQFLHGAPESNQNRVPHQFLHEASESQQHGDSHQFLSEASESNQHRASHQFLSEASDSNQRRGSYQFLHGAQEANQYDDSHHFLSEAPESHQYGGPHQIHLGAQESNQHEGSHFLPEAPESQQHRNYHQFLYGAPENNQHVNSHQLMYGAPQSNQYRGSQHLMHGAAEGMRWSYPEFGNSYRLHQSPGREWRWSYPMHGDMQPAPDNSGHGLSSFREIPYDDDDASSFSPGSRGRFQGPGYRHSIIQELPEDQSSSSKSHDRMPTDRKEKPRHALGLKRVKNRNSPIQQTDSGNLVLQSKIDSQRFRNRGDSVSPVAPRRPTASRIEKPRNTLFEKVKGTNTKPSNDVKTKKTHHSQSEDAKTIYKIHTKNAKHIHTENDNVEEENEHQLVSQTGISHNVPDAGIPTLPEHSAPVHRPKLHKNTHRLKTVYIPRTIGKHQRFEIPTNGDTKNIKIVNVARTKYEKNRKQSNIYPSDYQEDITDEDNSPLKPTYNLPKPINPPVHYAPVQPTLQYNDANIDKVPTADTDSNDETEPNTEETFSTQPKTIPLAPVNTEEFDDKVDTSTKEGTEAPGDFEENTAFVSDKKQPLNPLSNKSEKDETDNDDDGSTYELPSNIPGTKHIASKPSGLLPRPTNKPSTSSTSQTGISHNVPDAGVPTLPEHSAPVHRPKLHENTHRLKTVYIPRTIGKHQRFEIPTNGDSKNIKIVNVVKNEDDESKSGLRDAVLAALANARTKYEKNRKQSNIYPSDYQEDITDEDNSPLKPTYNLPKPINPPVHHAPVQPTLQYNDANIDKVPTADTDSNDETEPNTEETFSTQPKTIPLAPVNTEEFDDKVDTSTKEGAEATGDFEENTAFVSDKKQPLNPLSHKSEKDETDNDDDGSTYELPSNIPGTKHIASKPSSLLPKPTNKPSTSSTSQITNGDDAENDDKVTENIEDYPVPCPDDAPVQSNSQPAHTNNDEATAIAAKDDANDNSDAQTQAGIDDEESEADAEVPSDKIPNPPSSFTDNKGQSTKPSSLLPRPTKSSTSSTSHKTYGVDAENIDQDTEDIKDYTIPYPDDAPVQSNPQTDDTNIVLIPNAAEKPKVYQMPTKGEKKHIKIIKVFKNGDNYSKSGLRETVLAALAEARKEYQKNRIRSNKSPSDNRSDDVDKSNPKLIPAYNPKTKPISRPSPPVHHAPVKITTQNNDANKAKVPTAYSDSNDETEPNTEETFSTQPKTIPLAPVNTEEFDDKVDTSTKESTEATGDFEENTAFVSDKKQPLNPLSHKSEKDETDNDDDGSTYELPSNIPGTKHIASKPSGLLPKPTNKPSTSSTSQITNGDDAENDDKVTENIEDYPVPCPDDAPVQSNSQPADTNNDEATAIAAKDDANDNTDAQTQAGIDDEESEADAEVPSYKIPNPPSSFSDNNGQATKPSNLVPKPTNKPTSSTSQIINGDDEEIDDKATYDIEDNPIPRSENAPVQSKTQLDDSNKDKAAVIAKDDSIKNTATPAQAVNGNHATVANAKPISITQDKSTSPIPAYTEECEDSVETTSKPSQPSTPGISKEIDTEQDIEDIADSDGSSAATKQPSNPLGNKGFPRTPKPSIPTNKPSQYSSTSHISTEANTENESGETYRHEHGPKTVVQHKPPFYYRHLYKPSRLFSQKPPKQSVRQSPVSQTQLKSYPHKDTEDDSDDFGDGVIDTAQASISPAPADSGEYEDHSTAISSTQTLTKQKKKSSITISDFSKISSKKTTITPADDGNNYSDTANPVDYDLPLCEDEQAPATEASHSHTTLNNKLSQAEKASTKTITETEKKHIYKRVDGLKCVCELENIEKNNEEAEIIEAALENNQNEDLVETEFQNDKREVENEEFSETENEAVYFNDETDNIEIENEQGSVKNMKKPNNKGLFYRWFNQAVKG